MHSSTPEPVPQNIPSESIFEQTERVLASRHFKQTRTLDKFLRHAITKTLAGQEGELKESLIGREVFHRGEEFNPAVDAVVRVQAGMLRKKLAGYYAEEGLTDEIIIELPKGCYVPTFHLRESSSALTVVRAQAEIPLDESKIARTELPALPERVRLEIVSPTRWRIPAWSPLFAAFIIGMTFMFGVIQWRNRSQPAVTAQLTPAQSPSSAPLWEKFFEPGSATVLAYGTPQFFQHNGLYLRDVMVNSPQEIEQQAGLRLASVRKIFKETFNPIEVYTGVGEAHGIHTLTRFFWQHARELQITRNRLVGWQEVKNANLIFLSSMRFHTLAEQLNYPNDFAIKADGISGTIQNLRQAEGEQPLYGKEANDHYAVITLWPGKADNRRILHLSGNTTWGTLAAAEYATDTEALRKLQDQFEQCRQRHGWATHPPYFQVLVHAEVKDNQPISLSYVTHHDFNMAGNAGTEAKVAQISTQPDVVK